jgi:hypothetical protein
MFKVSTSSFHVGTSGDRLLEGYFLPPCLTIADYHDFQRKVLPELLQDVDLQTRINLWSVHDGAPPDFLFAFREFLNNVFLKQWTERGGQTSRPVPSPDLNPSHFSTAVIWSLLLVLQKSVTSRTCNSEYRMDLRWFVHLTFSSKSGI